MTLRISFALLALAIVGQPFARADVIHVPADQPTIQAGIGAAQDGDEVLVAAGVYTGPGNRNLNFGGRVITVRSESGPKDCVIDCQRLGRGFIFDSGEPPEAVLDGFTIRNGVTNRALGGGIYCPSASPTIRRCIIVDNDTDIFNGAGIYVGPGTEARIVDCIVRNNLGGGGAGIFCDGSFALITNCAFVANQAGVGGGTLCTGGQPTFVNCLFARNESPDPNLGGGAIFCNAGSTARFINCTITRNTTSGSGGAIYSNRSSAPVITNSILWGNEPDEIFLSGSSGDPVVTYCDVAGSWPGLGNIEVDPMFVDKGADDYQLTSPGSRCIDAANNEALPPDVADLDGDGNSEEPTPLDLSGQPRFLDDPEVEDTGEGFAPLVDMGAYEFQAGTGGCTRDPEWICDGDVDGDGQVNPVDSGLVQAAFGSTDEGDLCQYDVDCDGQINPVDSGIVQSLFGTCNPPRDGCP